MKNTQPTPEEKRIFTIPNLLSVFRILLIPVFIRMYCVHRKYNAAFFVLLLSGVTDIADGFIARHFHMISALGKALDPIADKLTQGAALFCLSTRFPIMLLLAVALVLKETITGVLSLVAVRKTSRIRGADWHGKAVTCLLYGNMLVHLLWADIPRGMTYALAGICLAAMLVSFVLYLQRNLADIGGAGEA